MKIVQQYLKSLFPLPQPIQQLIEAQAFLLISSKTTSVTQTLNKKTQIRCIEYETEKQARQNQVKYLSLSNAFHLSIISSQVKYLLNKNKWCLIIEMEAPQMSIKQKLTMNKNTFTHFTETQLILIIHSMNILFAKYFQHGSSQSLTANQLLDHIFITNTHQVKLAVPSLMYPLKVLSKTTQNKLTSQNQNSYKFSSFLIEVLTLNQQRKIKNMSLLQQKLSILQFQSFGMNQFKRYLIDQFKPLLRNNMSKNFVDSFQNNVETNSSNNIEKTFPKIRFVKSSKINKEKKGYFSSPKQKPIQSNFGKEDRSDEFSNKLEMKFLTLSEMVHDKVVQSFQQDEYSYILQSNNTSPSRISPHKGFPSLQFSKVSYEASPSRFSPVISQKIQQMSNSYQIETQKSQQNGPQRQSLQNSKASVIHNNSNVNSIILQVEQESNYQLVEASSARSDMIELSFSQNNDEITHFHEIQDENTGVKYYGQTLNGTKEGKGKMFYPDGGYYEGQWKSDSNFGFGRLFYPSNKLAYAGYWKEGCFHGPGLVLNEQIETVQSFDYTDFSNLGRTWISYRGNFNMDIRQGFGIVKISNGDSIAGIWENNCLNGEAEYRKQDGSIIKGIWKMNKLQKILPQQIKV